MHDEQTMDYKGYQVVLKPVRSGDALWYGGYEILKNGQTISHRTQIFPGSLYFKAACADSIEQAKIEIDNLTSEPGGVTG